MTKVINDVWKEELHIDQGARPSKCANGESAENRSYNAMKKGAAGKDLAGYCYLISNRDCWKPLFFPTDPAPILSALALSE